MDKLPIINGFDCSTCDTEPEGCPGCASSAKEAQRDSDYRYIEQACQEAANKIFESLDFRKTNYTSGDDGTPILQSWISEAKLQELKIKCLA